MRQARNWHAENLAEFLPAVLGYSRPPVDLYAVAHHRRVKNLKLRFIVPRGMLVPVEGGFEVYIRDKNAKDFDLETSKQEPATLLSTRQRFSLAHEIAHTFYYNITDNIPSPANVESTPDLEAKCNRTAGRILVPTDLLSKEIGDLGAIDQSLIRSLASKFRVSLPVMIDRVAEAERSNTIQRCVVLVKRRSDACQIQAFYFGAGLLSILPRPTKYKPIAHWLSDLPMKDLVRSGDFEWTCKRVNRVILFRKTEVGTRGDFLLQGDVEQ